MFSKKITALFICVLMVISMGVCPVFAEDTVYTFNNSNKIAEESTSDSWGGLWAGDKHYVTIDIRSLPEGNYKLTFNGCSTSTTQGMPLDFVCEIGGNDTIYGVVPWTGTDWGINTDVDMGTVCINQDSSKLKFSVVKGGSTYGYTFKFTRVGDYDKSASYRIVKAFKNDVTQTASTSEDGYGLYANNSITWSLDLAYDGIYDVIFFGGAMDNSNRDMAYTLSADGTEIFRGTAPWTGTDSNDYLGVSKGNAGWYTHKFTKAGTVVITKDVQSLTFTNKGPAKTSVMSDSYSRLLLVKVGDITPLNAPEIETVLDGENLKNSKVVIDFDKEVLNTEDNLRKIVVENAYGTAKIAVDSEDSSKVIITGVASKFTVSVQAGFAATDTTVTENTVSEECYIPSCTVTNAEFFPYGTSNYARLTVNSTAVGDVMVVLAFYDGAGNLVTAKQEKTRLGGYDGQPLQISIPNTVGEFATAKAFLWETDLTPILKTPAETTSATFVQ